MSSQTSRAAQSHAPAPTGTPVVLLTLAQCREITGWSVATQRIFVAHLDAFEGQGNPLPEAEAMAYAATKANQETSQANSNEASNLSTKVKV